jgi:cell wall-associated NlpC family hydrolase
MLLATLVAATLLSAQPAHASPPVPSGLLSTPVAQAAGGQLILVSRFYTVAPNDTLSGIAARFCGHASAYPAMAAASGITSPYLIYPHQRITLNCPVWPHSAPSVKAPPAAPVAPKLAASGSKQSVQAPPRAVAGIQGMIDYAMAQIGKPYVWGATGPGSFDCSGLVVAAFRSIGISLPHFTGDLLGHGRAVSRADLQPGDLVFPSTGHVMIYIGNGKVVHAPHAGANVQIGTIYAFYAARRIV